MAKRRKPSAPVKQIAAQTKKRSASQPKESQPRSRSAGRRHSQTSRSPLERAQDLAWKAFQATDIERRISLAQQALELSSDCADAYTVLARVVSDPRQALMMLEQGLAAAERTIGRDGLAEAIGHFWKIDETRPYMRARLELAECLWSIGRRDEAIGHLSEMVRLNPGDNQGIRYLLAAHLLELDRDADFDRLVEQYPEPTAFLLFSRVLREFRRGGDSREARKLLVQARAANKHIVPLLLHAASLPDKLPANYSRGQTDEAVLYLSDFGGGWRQTPGAITWLRKTIDAEARRPGKPPAGPTATVIKQLEKLPQNYGIIWQASISRVPTWLRDGELMVRPWSILIVDHTEHLIVGQELVTQEPTPDQIFDHLARTMRKPLVGKGHRPSEIQVRDDPFWRAVQPHLEEIGVDCIFRTELEEADFILGEMQKLMRPDGQPPGLTESATFTSSQGASLYAAAASYFLRHPWQKLAPSVVIQVDCLQLTEFGPGRWYAVVLGQGGQTLGLAIYNDLAAVEAICGGCCSEKASGGPSALSLLFGENFEIPITDLLAAEQHHWPLASPEAYPLVLCTTDGTNVRPVEPWELQLLEGCVRTIPDFLERCPYADGPASATIGPVAPANLKFTLSWIEPEVGDCGEECDHCEQ